MLARRTPLARSSDLATTACLVALGAAVSGCSGAPDAEPLPSLEGPPDWIVEVVRDPTRFSAMLERSGQEGWVKLHANELRAAHLAFQAGDEPGKIARARTEWQLALLYSDLSRASDYLHMSFLSGWAARELPVTPAVATLSARWRSCGGLDDMDVPDPARLPGVFRTEVVLVEAIEPHLLLHTKALAGDPEPLYLQSTTPLMVESAEGFERTFYDPCTFPTLEESWSRAAIASSGAPDFDHVAAAWTSADLEGRLFAPWLTDADLVAELAKGVPAGTLGATQPSLVHFGVSTETSVQDDVDFAREDVRAMDAAIDLRERALRSEASADGIALLSDLGLHHRFRQEWIAARARKALLEGRPHQAMAYLELARDVSRRGVGPTNTPSVLALYAEAQIRLGRTREALDVLVLLQEAHPEVVGLRELTGDVAVLQGLDRHGDSKEN